MAGTPLDDEILADDGNDFIAARLGNDTVDAGGGNDTVLPGTGSDSVTTGTGTDTVIGTAEELDGDTITDFQKGDAIRFVAGAFDISDVSIASDAISTTLSVDTDGDGQTDATITLEGDFTGETFIAYPVGADVAISLQPDYNTIPVANDDAANTIVDTAVTVNVVTNDEDADGNLLTIDELGTPEHGEVTDNGDGTVTYTPEAGFIGQDMFTYRIFDGVAGRDRAVVTIDIGPPANTPPVATPDAPTGDEDSVLSGAVTATDAQSDPVTFAKASDPSFGVAAVASDGSYTYTPNANFNGADSFTVTASDGNGGTDTVTVLLTVAPVNDAPIAVDDATSTT